MHQDEGNYRGKHPEGTVMDEKTAEALRSKIVNERISCSAAHKAAEEAGVSPQEAGRALDLLEVRINGCQLGLFGFKGDRGKADLRMPEAAEKIIEAVESRMENNRISCQQLWEAAEEAGCAKMTAAGVCEARGIKIHSCQLGAF